MTSSSKPSPAFGVAVFRRRRNDQASQGSQNAHVNEGLEEQAVGVDTRQFGSFFIAAHCIDAAADLCLAGDEGIKGDQDEHDHEYVW